jgi:hypothetical protein
MDPGKNAGALQRHDRCAHRGPAAARLIGDRLQRRVALAALAIVDKPEEGMQHVNKLAGELTVMPPFSVLCLRHRARCMIRTLASRSSGTRVSWFWNTFSRRGRKAPEAVGLPTANSLQLGRRASRRIST